MFKKFILTFIILVLIISISACSAEVAPEISGVPDTRHSNEPDGIEATSLKIYRTPIERNFELPDMETWEEAIEINYGIDIEVIEIGMIHQSQVMAGSYFIDRV